MTPGGSEAPSHFDLTNRWTNIALTVIECCAPCVRWALRGSGVTRRRDDGSLQRSFQRSSEEYIGFLGRLLARYVAPPAEEDGADGEDEGERRAPVLEHPISGGLRDVLDRVAGWCIDAMADSVEHGGEFNTAVVGPLLWMAVHHCESCRGGGSTQTRGREAKEEEQEQQTQQTQHGGLSGRRLVKVLAPVIAQHLDTLIVAQGGYLHHGGDGGVGELGALDALNVLMPCLRALLRRSPHLVDHVIRATGDQLARAGTMVGTAPKEPVYVKKILV